MYAFIFINKFVCVRPSCKSTAFDNYFLQSTILEIVGSYMKIQHQNVRLSYLNLTHEAIYDSDLKKQKK